MWVEPKTDWTGSDTYNLDSNLTRVEGNIHEVSTALQAMGYSFTLDEKLTWTRLDFLSAAQLGRIIGNLKAMEEQVPVPEGLPELAEPPDQGFFTADTANALEQHTLALKQIADGMNRLLVPCGAIQCGEPPLLPF